MKDETNSLQPTAYSISSYIDCHTHLLPPKRSENLIKWARTFMPDHPVPLNHTNEDIIQDLRSAGAKRWVNLLYPLWKDESRELNRFGAELDKKYSEMTTFGGVSASDPDPLSVVKEAIGELGLAGIKFHPMVQHFSPAENSLRPIYPYLEKEGRAVYIHTGFDEWYNWWLPAEDLEWIVENHPGLGVVLSHLRFPHLKWTFDLAERCPNVWLDATNVFGTMAMLKTWGGTDLAGEAKYGELEDELTRRIPEMAHRVFFGTDHPAGLGDIPQILRDLHDFGLDEKTMKQILIDTPTAFLNRYGKY